MDKRRETSGPAPPGKPGRRLRFEDEAATDMPDTSPPAEEDGPLPDISPGERPPASTSGQNVPKSKDGSRLPDGKFRQDSKKPRPSDRLRHDEAPPTGGGADPKPDKKAARDDKKINHDHP